jgi:hypothetical protein
LVVFKINNDGIVIDGPYYTAKTLFHSFSQIR